MSWGYISEIEYGKLRENDNSWFFVLNIWAKWGAIYFCEKEWRKNKEQTKIPAFGHFKWKCLFVIQV